MSRTPFGPLLIAAFMLAGLPLAAQPLDLPAEGPTAEPDSTGGRIDTSSVRRDPPPDDPATDLAADSADAVEPAEPLYIPSRQAHSLFLGTMIGSITSRDEAGSPLTYSGISFPFLAGYRYDGDVGRHRLFFSYRKTGINAPTLTSAQTTARGTEDGTRVAHTVDYSLRWFSYRYSHLVAEPFDRRVRLLGGLLWENILFFRYYTYAERPLFDRELSIGSWEGIFSLDLSLEVEYDIDDRSRLSAEIHAPFIAFLFRPRYSIQDDELIKISFDNFSQLNNGRSRFVTQGELLQAGAGVGYSHELNDRLDIRLDYSFHYSRIEYPRESATVENGLAVTLGYRM